MVVDPLNSNTVYVGTDGGGIVKSINGGGNWVPINTGFTSNQALALAVHPSEPNILYAATFSGVFRTMDGGANWIAINSGLPPTQINDIIIDPSNPKVVYVATGGSGVYKSINGGMAWTPTGTSTGNGTPPAASISNVSGDFQTGLPNQILPYPFVTVITNSGGVPVSGVSLFDTQFDLVMDPSNRSTLYHRLAGCSIRGAGVRGNSELCAHGRGRDAIGHSIRHRLAGRDPSPG